MAARVLASVHHVSAAIAAGMPRILLSIPRLLLLSARLLLGMLRLLLSMRLLLSVRLLLRSRLLLSMRLLLSSRLLLSMRLWLGMLLLWFGLGLLVTLSMSKSSGCDKTKQNCRDNDSKWFHDGCLTIQLRRGRRNSLSRFDHFENRRFSSARCNLVSVYEPYYEPFFVSAAQFAFGVKDTAV